MDRVVIVGAGGHATVVGELVELSEKYELAGWVDSGLDCEVVNGYKVLGNDAVLSEIFTSGIRYAIIGVGSVGDVSIRKRLLKLLKAKHFEFINLNHPRSIISKRIAIGEGTCVMAGAVIQTNVTIGNHCIINSNATIEHGCKIGSFVHIAPGSVIAGGVDIEDDVHIGLGAVVREGVTIAKGAMIGAGAVVIRDVKAGTTVYGVPAAPKK